VLAADQWARDWVERKIGGQWTAASLN
jgi:hypothetical protein